MNLVKEMFIKVALLAFYISTVLFHKRVNEFVDIFYKKYSFEATNRFFIYSLVIPLFIIIIFFLYKAFKRDKKTLIISLPIILVPLILYYILLFVSNVEVVHYLQYAILSMLILRVSRNVVYSFITSSLLGVIDEMYQYYVLYAGTKGIYLDYNDMLFNVHGTIIGIVFYLIFTDKLRNSERESNVERTLVKTA